jgi:hypothetical protein
VNDSGAIASLVCGIAAWVICGFFTGIPAIILGHGAAKKIRYSGGHLKGKEIAFAGMVLGYCSCAFWLVFLAVGFVLYQQAEKETAAAESSALEVMRQVHEAEVTYAQSYPSSSASHSFAGSLAVLGPGPQGTCIGIGTREYACLMTGPVVMPDCREPKWCALHAYKFQLQKHYYPDKRDEDYVITGVPADRKSGGRNFCATSDGIIRSESSLFGVGAGYSSEECLKLEPITEKR